MATFGKMSERLESHHTSHSGSVDQLFIILRGFGGCEHFGLYMCPPAYILILIKVCLSLHESHGEHAESLMWFRFL
jgi:hypothetical protein